MKVIEPEPVSYTVEFTHDELIELAMLSYRFQGGSPFFAACPTAIQETAEKRAEAE